MSTTFIQGAPITVEVQSPNARRYQHDLEDLMLGREVVRVAVSDLMGSQDKQITVYLEDGGSWSVTGAFAELS